MTDRFAMSGQGGEHTIEHCQNFGLYCGGTWQGLMDNLDYIQGMNFNAIWVSPVVANLPQHTIDGEAYAGYWSQDIYGLNENFGSAYELKALVQAMHERDMYFMMDVVPNHMGYNGNVTNPIDYSVFSPFNDEKYYHPYCEMDYSGTNATALQECWLGSEEVPLVDLRTEDDEVADKFGDWIEWMVETYDVDGLRIDAGVNVGPDFLEKFVKRAGIFATAEVYIEDTTIACQYQEAMGSVLNYPLHWPMVAAFQKGGDGFDALADMMKQQADSCPDVTTLATFSENQDVPRFANYTQDMAHAKNVAAYVLMADGIPVIYQGIEQHFTGGTDPFTNREPVWQTEFDVFTPIYRQIAVLNTLRLHMARTDDDYITTQTKVLSTSSDFMAMSKGKGSASVVSVFTNREADSSSSSLDISDSPFDSNTELTEVLSCDTLTTDSDGGFSAETTGGEPLVFVASDMLKNSSLCGHDGKKFAQPNLEQSTTQRVQSATSASGSSAPTSTAVATIPVVHYSETAVTANPTATGSDSAASSTVISSWSWAPVSLLAIIISNGLLGAGLVMDRRR
ncbi:hypothetical protein MBLNU230_g3549t1 [Neophaeotheca triangularis]